MRIPLARPDITEQDIQAVVDVLKTPNLSLGPKLGEFEKAFCQFTGARYAVAKREKQGLEHRPPRHKDQYSGEHQNQGNSLKKQICSNVSSHIQHQRHTHNQ